MTAFDYAGDEAIVLYRRPILTLTSYSAAFRTQSFTAMRGISKLSLVWM